jgi:hypothetical protein
MVQVQHGLFGEGAGHAEQFQMGQIGGKLRLITVLNAAVNWLMMPGRWQSADYFSAASYAAQCQCRKSLLGSRGQQRYASRPRKAGGSKHVTPHSID